MLPARPPGRLRRMTGSGKAPPHRRGSRDYWLERAAQANAIAAQLGENESRANVLAVAKSYEVLAAHSEPEPQATRLALLVKQAADRVIQGEQHIAKQRALIATLKSDGHDVAEADRLLRTFEETQVLHVEHRDWLRREEAQAAGAAKPGKAIPGLHRRRAGRHNPH